eukprot:1541200-Pleurochrysis_carterae.AAC.7
MHKQPIAVHNRLQRSTAACRKRLALFGIAITTTLPSRVSPLRAPLLLHERITWCQCRPFCWAAPRTPSPRSCAAAPCAAQHRRRRRDCRRCTPRLGRYRHHLAVLGSSPPRLVERATLQHVPAAPERPDTAGAAGNVEASSCSMMTPAGYNVCAVGLFAPSDDISASGAKAAVTLSEGEDPSLPPPPAKDNAGPKAVNAHVASGDPTAAKATEALWLKDTYNFSATATALAVASCEEPGHWDVVLDATPFHPQGGGQPSDIGLLVAGEREFDVVRVHAEKSGASALVSQFSSCRLGSSAIWPARTEKQRARCDARVCATSCKFLFLVLQASCTTRFDMRAPSLRLRPVQRLNARRALVLCREPTLRMHPCTAPIPSPPEVYYPAYLGRTASCFPDDVRCLPLQAYIQTSLSCFHEPHLYSTAHPVRARQSPAVRILIAWLAHAASMQVDEAVRRGAARLHR